MFQSLSSDSSYRWYMCFSKEENKMENPKTAETAETVQIKLYL